MWPTPQEATDLVTFIEEILNGKLHFCAESEGYLEFCQAIMIEIFYDNVLR